MMKGWYEFWDLMVKVCRAIRDKGIKDRSLNRIENVLVRDKEFIYLDKKSEYHGCDLVTGYCLEEFNKD